ncbi:MAG: hypothetical protein R3D85_15270 [Paracoccaceae bacterium]
MRIFADIVLNCATVNFQQKINARQGFRRERPKKLPGGTALFIGSGK